MCIRDRVNGACGIGTGFSTNILCYNPITIISYIQSKLLPGTSGEEFEFIPYYRGFTGQVIPVTATSKTKGVEGMKFLVKGIYSKKNENVIVVSELPIGMWIDTFKELLEKLCATTDKDGKKLTPHIKNYEENCTDKTIHFTITFMKDKLGELEAMPIENGVDGIEKLLKLYSIETTSNMHLFDSNDKLKKYSCVEEIIDDYFGVRWTVYEKRKEYMINMLENELLFLRNKVRYIQDTIDGIIDLRNKKSDWVTNMLEERGFDKIEDKYHYLIKLPMDSVTEENIVKLKRDFEIKTEELQTLRETSITDMWNRELVDLYRLCK